MHKTFGPGDKGVIWNHFSNHSCVFHARLCVLLIGLYRENRLSYNYITLGNKKVLRWVTEKEKNSSRSKESCVCNDHSLHA